MPRLSILAAVLAALAAPAAAQSTTRSVGSAYSAGVTVEYRTDVQPFGGMYTANYHLDNANPYPVRVSFTATYTLEGGQTVTRRKGPIRVRANATARTGWSGEGDVWERGQGGYPVAISFSNWSVQRDG